MQRLHTVQRGHYRFLFGPAICVCQIVMWTRESRSRKKERYVIQLNRTHSTFDHSDGENKWTRLNGSFNSFIIHRHMCGEPKEKRSPSIMISAVAHYRNHKIGEQQWVSVLCRESIKHIHDYPSNPIAAQHCIGFCFCFCIVETKTTIFAQRVQTRRKRKKSYLVAPAIGQ